MSDTHTTKPDDKAPIIENDDEDMILDLGGDDDLDTAIEDEVTQQGLPRPKAEPKEVDPAAGLAELKGQQEERSEADRQLEERNRRLEAENARLTKLASEAQAQGISLQEALLNADIDTTTKEIDRLKSERRQALMDGDYDKEADLNADLAKIAAKANNLEGRKTYLEEMKARGVNVQPQVPTGDPIERAIQGFKSELQPWLRKHPEVFRVDGTLKTVVVSAHNTALDEGLEENTPEYYERIAALTDGKLGAPKKADAPAPKAKAEPRKGPARFAAPVERNAPSGRNGSLETGPNGEFVLTAAMRRAARIAGAPETISYKDWAREYVKGVKNGSIQPID